MSKLNREEFKELLTEWKQNFINERAPGMIPKLDDIIGSNVKSLSSLSLERKMQSLPILIIDINDISGSNEVYSDLLNSIEQDSDLRNHSRKEIDDPKSGSGRTLFQWEKTMPVYRALYRILHSKNLLNRRIQLKDLRNSSIIIFKSPSFNADDPYSNLASNVEKNTYDNVLWTLHDVMHRISEEFGVFSFDDKSFEGDYNVPRIFFKTVSQAISHSDDKFAKHIFQSGEDFTPSYIVFLYMYIIEVLNGKVDIQKSLTNLNKFLTSLSSQNQEFSSEVANIIKTKTKNILDDINVVLEEESYIQLLLFKSIY